MWVLTLPPASGVASWRAVETTGEAPCARTGHAMALLRTPSSALVVVVGGCSASSGFLCDVHLLCTESWRWIQLEAPAGQRLFSPRDKQSAVAFGSRLLLWGGFGPGAEAVPGGAEGEAEEEGADEEEGEEEEEEAASFTWFSELHALEQDSDGAWRLNALEATGEAPTARAAHAAAAVGGRMFVFGGRDAGGRTGDTWSLDTSSLCWRREAADAPAPAPRSFHALLPLPPPHQGAVCFGGVGADGALLDCVALLDCRAALPVWRSVKERAGEWPAPRSRMAAAMLGSRLVLLGGAGADERPCDDAVLDLGEALRALQAAA